MLKTICVLLVFSVFFVQDAGYAQKSSVSESWQTSWEKFVESHNSCIKDAACDRKRFLDKEVRWVGVVMSVDLGKQPPTVVMDMPGPPLLDQNGVSLDKASDLFVFVLNPDSAEAASWKGLAKGERVRFRARTSGGITGSVVSFSAISGRKMLMVNTRGGEFIERLPKETN